MAKFWLSYILDIPTELQTERRLDDVVEAEDSDGKLLFTLGSTDNLSKSDYSFSTEHILAIYEYNLKDRAESAFTTNSSYSKAQNVLSPRSN